jgi:hypothetical protein
VEVVHDVLGFLAQFAIRVLGLIAVVLAVAAFWTALGLLATAATGAYRLVCRRLAEAPAVATPPAFWLALLVRFDEDTGRFQPSVQVRGVGEFTRSWIRLELVDDSGTVRLVRRKRFARTALSTELPLPDFESPEGTSPEEVLGWHWDVVLEDKEGERARWREHPRPAGYLNAEAELAIPA